MKRILMIIGKSKKIKILMIVLIPIVIAGVTFYLLGSGAEPESDLVPQTVTVQRGDLRIDVTSSGNLALSLTEDLAFEMSGTVEEILVEEGDSVKEGQVLAKLDTSQWEQELVRLEKAVLQKQDALQAAEEKLEDTEYTLELALLNAKINLQMEWNNLFSTEESYGNYLNVEIAELKVDRAKMEKEQAQEDLENIAEELAEQERQVRLAELDLEYAQKDFGEAKATVPEIIAPFDGFIIRVNVEGGDEVLKGTVAVELADPDKFEADILVSEMDIMQVEPGGEAEVQIDAMFGMTLPATVTYISPTATIQSGVVNYRVKVEVESLKPIAQEQQEQRAPTGEQLKEAIDKMLSGELPDGLKQQIEAGIITQEQANEMINRIRQGVESGMVTREQVEGMIKQRFQEQGGLQRPTMTIAPEDLQLREGLTVIVSIIVDERTDVLLVPNGAIATRRGQTYVQVILADGTIEERAITTGISDWQYTEVTDGLNEGEQVVITQGTATTTTTTQQQRPPGGMMIPGMGRPH